MNTADARLPENTSQNASVLVDTGIGVHAVGCPTVTVLPPAPTLFAIMGPSAILLATSVGSGEFIVFPAFIQQHGLSLLWAALIGFVTQFIINMEIARYTLASGETILTGFARLNQRWVWPLLVMNIVPWIWPGWVTGSSRCLSYLFGLTPAGEVITSIGLLLAIGLVLTLGPVVYRSVLRVQTVFVIIIFVGMIVIGAMTVRGDAIAEAGRGIANVGNFPADLNWPLFMTAFAFAGAGGTLNLAQSYYIRDKQLGMARGLSRLYSPLTGKRFEGRVDVAGQSFVVDSDSLPVWRRWWKLCNAEHFLVFLLPGVLSVVILSMIAYSIIPSGSAFKDMDFVKFIGDSLGERFGGWARVLYLVMGIAILLSTAVGILDTTGRISADVIKSHVAPIRERASVRPGMVYACFVWLQIVFGVIVLAMGVRQPLLLITISGTLNGFVMAAYCAILLFMNGRILNRAISISWWRFVGLLWAVGFYGYFSWFSLRSLLA